MTCPRRRVLHLTGLTAIDIAINNGSIQLLRRLEQHCPYAAYLAVKVSCCAAHVKRSPHRPDFAPLQATATYGRTYIQLQPVLHYAAGLCAV